MDIYITQWLALIAVFSLAVISPGPDFVMAVRNSLVFSRRAGIFTAIGFGFGQLIHVTYTALGISAIISSSIILFNIIKWVGALYLIYIGIQALRSKGASQQTIHIEKEGKRMSDSQALWSGFLTNALNPKATLFCLAVFSQILSPETPIVWQAIYGATCVVMVTVWFILVALFLNQNKIRDMFLRFAKYIDRVCGTLMIALGIKVALSSK